ncbi:MAG: type II secretion system F family protein, partial [candidate division KSB1 bacterium]|nr:type II secretion system F family protein [candidate division KSB1 bacterium]
MKERERKFTSERNSKRKISQRHHLKHSDLVIFTRQLATMVEARLPLASSLEMLAQYSKGEKVTTLIHDLAGRVNEGNSLAISLSKYPKIFNSLYINMVEVGETAGILDVTLDRLANHLEKMMSLKRKIISALSYPAIILVVAIGAISFLLTAIVPTFAELFHDFGAELPGPTKLIIRTADVLKQHGF